MGRSVVMHVLVVPAGGRDDILNLSNRKRCTGVMRDPMQDMP